MGRSEANTMLPDPRFSTVAMLQDGVVTGDISLHPRRCTSSEAMQDLPCNPSTDLVSISR